VVVGVERLEAAVSELVRSARLPLHDGAVSATCDVVAVARERAEFWSALAEDDGRDWHLRVEVDDAPAGPGSVVRLAGSEVAAAIDALVGNVFAHTPEGGAYAIAVRTGGHGTVSVEVEDAGPGIDLPAVALGRGVTRAGSTGLGLDIARRAAEAAGGHLDVGRSTDLGGARVALVIPTVAGP
jgi:signal transduction histidine kinase